MSWCWVRRKTKTTKGLYASLHYIDAFRSKMKVEWEKLYSKTDLFKHKWSGLVSCSQHSCFGTCPFEEGGCSLAVKVCICILIIIYIFVFSMWHIQCLVWQRAFIGIVLPADQHRKWSCLARASTCFWTQGTEYLQQITQSAQFQLVCGTGNFFFFFYWYNLQGKHLLVKTSICWSSRGCALH